MKAAIYSHYGDADTVRIADVQKPTPGPNEVLVRVTTTSVTTADWRLRAAAFPGILWLPGRLMFGLFKPRKPVLGVELSGTVAAIGKDVTRFHVGQRVFGFSGGGAHADYVALPETGALVATPDDLSDEDAAAMPFGAVAALVFLRDVAKIAPGQSVLIVGGSGGVGVYAIQIAKALGAHVTAVASAGNAGLMRDLGADAVIDYRAEDPSAARSRYDLVFDTIGTTDWVGMRRALKPNGLFLPLNFKGRDLWHVLRAKLAGGPRIVLHVNGDDVAHLHDLLKMIDSGTLRPVIDRHYPLEQINDAYRYVENRHRKGAVLIDVAADATTVPASGSDLKLCA